MATDPNDRPTPHRVVVITDQGEVRARFIEIEPGRWVDTGEGPDGDGQDSEPYPTAVVCDEIEAVLT